jgi:hypothetical protein
MQLKTANRWLRSPTVFGWSGKLVRGLASTVILGSESHETVYNVSDVDIGGDEAELSWLT